MNKIDICKTIQMNVSKLTESENLELFKIILDTNANYTKNNNGIFLNLNWIEEDLLIKINNYILFCIKSQNEISKYELMKTLLNDSINTKDNNSNEDASLGKSCVNCSCLESVNRHEGDSSCNGNKCGNGNNDECSNKCSGVDGVNSGKVGDNTIGNTDNSIQVSVANSINPKQKFSSSMKFYLLKKKFMKQNTNYSNCLENDLTYEDYLIT
jgi:hypothetical protein